MLDKCNVCDLLLVEDQTANAYNAGFNAEFTLPRSLVPARRKTPIWQERRCRQDYGLPSQEDARAVPA